MNISACGIDCDVACIECNKHNEEFALEPCRGCNAAKGKLFWASYLGLETCPIYNCCVNEKQLAHCGKCTELPCPMYFSTKDPSISDEQFEQNIQERVIRLKNR